MIYTASDVCPELESYDLNFLAELSFEDLLYKTCRIIPKVGMAATAIKVANDFKTETRLPATITKTIGEHYRVNICLDEIIPLTGNPEDFLAYQFKPDLSGEDIKYYFSRLGDWFKCFTGPPQRCREFLAIGLRLYQPNKIVKLK